MFFWQRLAMTEQLLPCVPIPTLQLHSLLSPANQIERAESSQQENFDDVPLEDGSGQQVREC